MKDLFKSLKQWFKEFVEEPSTEPEEIPVDMKEPEPVHFSTLTRNVILNREDAKLIRLQNEIKLIEIGVGVALKIWKQAAADNLVDYFAYVPSTKVISFDPTSKDWGNIPALAIDLSDSDKMFVAKAKCDAIHERIACGSMNDECIKEWKDFNQRMREKFTALMKQEVVGWTMGNKGHLTLVLREALYVR